MNKKIKEVLQNVFLNIIFSAIYPLFFMFISLAINGGLEFSYRIWLISYIGSMIIYRIALCFITNFKPADIWFIIMSIIFYVTSVTLNSIEVINQIQYIPSIVLLILFSAIISIYIFFIDIFNELIASYKLRKKDLKFVNNLRNPREGGK